MRTLLALAVAASVAAVTLGGARASAGTSVTFPYEDERLLRPGEKDGGLAYLTQGVEQSDEAVPLVVFLHGLNDGGPIHFWYGFYNRDLRIVADEVVAAGKTRPFVLAAPSQDVAAGAFNTIWADFDLDTFVAATERALPPSVTIDPDSIVLVGHSGAGCNPKGGLVAALGPFEITRLSGVVDVDTCFDASVGTALGDVPAGTPVWVYFQRFTWTRDFDLFRDAFQQQLDRVPGRIGRVVEETRNGPDPHNDILERAFREAIPSLIPKVTPDPYE